MPIKFTDLEGKEVEVDPTFRPRLTEGEQHAALHLLEKVVSDLWALRADHATKVSIIRDVQSAYFLLTGWHLTGAAGNSTPRPAISTPATGRGLPPGINPEENNENKNP